MPEEPVPRYESFQDRLVREAIERGEFDGLEGAGKPLRMRHVGDPDWWIKDKIERERIADDLRELEQQRARRRMQRPR